MYYSSSSTKVSNPKNVWDDDQRLVIAVLRRYYDIEWENISRIFNHLFQAHLRCCGFDQGIPRSRLVAQHGDYSTYRVREAVFDRPFNNLWLDVSNAIKEAAHLLQIPLIRKTTDDNKDDFRRGLSGGKNSRVLSAFQAKVLGTRPFLHPGQRWPSKVIHSQSQRTNKTSRHFQSRVPFVDGSRHSVMSTPTVMPPITHDNRYFLTSYPPNTEDHQHTSVSSPTNPPLQVDENRMHFSSPILNMEETHTTAFTSTMTPLRISSNVPITPISLAHGESTPTSQQNSGLVPSLLYRTYTTENAGINRPDIFVAGQFAQLRSQLPEAPPTYSSLYQSNMENHINRRTIPSPFISLTDSLLWAVFLASKNPKKSHISVIETAHLENVSPVISFIKDIPLDPCHRRYRGSSEYLAWGKIAKSAIRGDFRFRSLEKIAMRELCLEEFYSARSVPQISVTMAAKDLALDTRAGVALARIVRLMGLNAFAESALIVRALETIVQGWSFRSNGSPSSAVTKAFVSELMENETYLSDMDYEYAKQNAFKSFKAGIDRGLLDLDGIKARRSRSDWRSSQQR